MALTEEQWSKAEETLSGFLGVVKLRLGADELTLEKRFVAENRLAIVVFINGTIQPIAGLPDSEHHNPLVTQVWRKRTMSVYKPSQQKRIIKDFGKRAAKKHFPDLEKKREFFTPDFSTFASLKRTFSKLKELEVVSE